MDEPSRENRNGFVGNARVTVDEPPDGATRGGAEFFAVESPIDRLVQESEHLHGCRMLVAVRNRGKMANTRYWG